MRRSKKPPGPPSPALPCRCAGVCYPREREELLDYVQEFFDQPDGPAWTPDAEASLPPQRGLLAPHIDFRVSTLGYARAFEGWLKRPAADTYLILGVGHRGGLPWSLDARPYLTPFGRVEAAAGLIKEIASGAGFPLAEPSAHVGEHSIEFPVVLLQALRTLRGIERPFTFVPVLCGGLFDDVAAGRPPAPGSELDHLAEAIAPIVARMGPELQVIVSIDGCHFGPRFDHKYKVDPARLKECRDWEDTLWRHVEARDLDGFFAHLGRDGNARYFDGVGALALAMKVLGPQFQLRRTRYEQWFELADHSAVTFSSGVLE
jgi:AmmeMemoRadiSam system protein B